MIARAPSVPKNVLALVAATILVLGLAASASAADRAVSLRFSSLPERAALGSVVTVSVSVRPGSARCSLAVRYADGTKQASLRTVTAVRGRASWRWRVSPSTSAGPATVTVACAKVGRVSRSLTVVKGGQASVQIGVEKHGFSQRNNPSGGSSVSYGLVLVNPSPDRDVVDLIVLVNFVDANNVVLGKASTRVAGISAGSTYYLGGSGNLSTATPVSRLEVTIQNGGLAPASIHEPPVSDVRILPSREPGWVGSVEGQILNDHPSLYLSRARISVVVFDPAGNVVGGSTGFSGDSLPPGTRVYFSTMSGLRSIPLDRASVAQVSIEPTFAPPETPETSQ